MPKRKNDKIALSPPNDKEAVHKFIADSSVARTRGQRKLINEFVHEVKLEPLDPGLKYYPSEIALQKEIKAKKAEEANNQDKAEPREVVNTKTYIIDRNAVEDTGNRPEECTFTNSPSFETRLYVDLMTTIKCQLPNIDINAIRWHMFKPQFKMIIITGDVVDR